MSFISLSVAAPSLNKRFVGKPVPMSVHAGGLSAPLETSIIRHKLVEVSHELVDRLTHVHVSHVGPHRIRVRKDCRLVFVRANRGLELVPAQPSSYGKK